MSAGVFPEILKRAHIIPVPKCHNPSIDDFRPISMISCVAKIIEKIALKKWLFTIVPKIKEDQFAFIPRKGQGTVTALTSLVNRMLSFLDSPGAVRILMIDYSKAFDTLPHRIIINALISFNAPTKLVSWVSSYLENRTQCVRIKDNISSTYIPTSGVPQGGVLSPILFALAVDSLNVQCANSCLIKYADDICLLHFVRKEQDDNLTQELEHIISWSSSNGLFFNPQKTKLMNIQTKRSLSLAPVYDTQSNTAIEEVSSAKILGLIIDNKLLWNEHIDYILAKVRKRMYILHTLKQVNAPDCVLWMVYCAIFRSVMSYSYPAWCNISESRYQPLLSFERRVCRMFGITCKINFSNFCLSLCQRLAKKLMIPDIHFIASLILRQRDIRQDSARLTEK